MIANEPNENVEIGKKNKWISDKELYKTIKSVLRLASNKGDLYNNTWAHIKKLDLNKDNPEIDKLLSRSIRVKPIKGKKDIADFLLKKSKSRRYNIISSNARSNHEKGLNDAVLSLIKLIHNAEKCSFNPNPNAILLRHFKKAYFNDFCAFWPFC